MRNTKILQSYFDLENIELPQKTLKLETPMKPHRAKIFGYKNSPQYTVLLSNIRKGGIEPLIPKKGRAPTNNYRKFSRDISLKRILKEKIMKKHPNMDFVCMYLLKVDKYRRWYQIILKNPSLNLYPQ